MDLGDLAAQLVQKPEGGTQYPLGARKDYWTQ